MMPEVCEATIGRVECEVMKRGTDHARIDMGGIVSSKGMWPDRDRKSVGGVLEIRFYRDKQLRLTVWTELAHDLAQAANAAIWRHIERKRAASPPSQDNASETEAA